MTREQARREIDDIDYYLQHHTDDYSESSHTAMMIAISALEQEPCEDAISREAAIKALSKGEGCGNVCMLSLKRLPSVQPSRKGHWIKERPWLKVHCSECGKDAIGNHGFDELKTDFCPHCGADMRGKENNV